jgi:hypothetical protein
MESEAIIVRFLNTLILGAALTIPFADAVLKESNILA